METEEISKQDVEFVDKCFTYHSPKPDEVEAMLMIRNLAKNMAYMLTKVMEPGREYYNAIMFLESAVMHANAGIVRHGLNNSSAGD